MATLPDDVIIALEDVWKTYPPTREAHPLVRKLARLGGIELDSGLAPDDGGGDDDDDAGGDDDLGDDIDGTDERPPQPGDPLDEDFPAGNPGGTDALRGVSLIVEPGTCVGIVGPPGSGKSVLLRLIAGLSPPTAGRVLVRGLVAPALPSVVQLLTSRDGIRKTVVAVGMMTRLPRREVKRRLPEIFELAGLRDSDLRLGTKLTSAQRQRVVLALMLSVDADVVLVDLPLSVGHVREGFLERIRELRAAGVTVIVVADSADEIVELADRIVRLVDGRVGLPGGDVDDADLDDDLDVVDPVAVAEQAALALPSRDLPLSADAERYREFIRVLVGDRRADRAGRLAMATAPDDAALVEWNDIARCAGFDPEQHVAIVERLRRLHGAEDDGPIAGSAARRDLPLSGDASRYVDHLRVLLGDERAEDAKRTARELAPDEAERIEWTWIAKRAGLDWVEDVPVIERLRRLDSDDDDEPIFGVDELRRKMAERRVQTRQA